MSLSFLSSTRSLLRQYAFSFESSHPTSMAAVLQGSCNDDRKRAALCLERSLALRTLYILRKVRL